MSTIRTTSVCGGVDVVGTPGYMGPEKLGANTKGVMSHLVDIFAYDVVLWQPLTKCEPYGDGQENHLSEHPRWGTAAISHRCGLHCTWISLGTASPCMLGAEMGTDVAYLRACVKQGMQRAVIRALSDCLHLSISA